MDTMRTPPIPLKSARGRLIPELPYVSDLLGSPARPDWNVVDRQQCGVLPRDLAEFLDVSTALSSRDSDSRNSSADDDSGKTLGKRRGAR